MYCYNNMSFNEWLFEFFWFCVVALVIYIDKKEEVLL
jgi:hypothetical protein